MFLGDQSSSLLALSHYWVKPKHTRTHTHTFTIMSGQQMPRFTYDYSGKQPQSKKTHMLGCKCTHKCTQLHAPSLMCTCAHHLLAAGYNEMEDGLRQRRDGVTLSGSAQLALTQSRAPVAPASPPSLRHRQDERGGSNLGWRVELETLCAALGSVHCNRRRAMPNPAT